MTHIALLSAFILSAAFVWILFQLDRSLKVITYKVDLHDDFHRSLLNDKLMRAKVEWYSNLNSHDLACVQSFERAESVDHLNADQVQILQGRYQMAPYPSRGRELTKRYEKMLTDTRSSFFSQN